MPFDDTVFLKTKVDLLGFFNEVQLRDVTPDIERRSYAKGDMVVLKGEILNNFYIVKKGKVAVLWNPTSGESKTRELGAGGFFGEISLLEDASATASVKALDNDTEVLMIPHNSFQKLLQIQPMLKRALLDKVAAFRKS